MERECGKLTNVIDEKEHEMHRMQIETLLQTGHLVKSH